MSEFSCKYASTSLYLCQNDPTSEMKHMSYEFQSNMFQGIPRKPRCLLTSSHLPWGSGVRYAVPRPPRFRMHAVCVWKNGRQQLLHFKDYDLPTWRRSCFRGFVFGIIKWDPFGGGGSKLMPMDGNFQGFPLYNIWFGLGI